MASHLSYVCGFRGCTFTAASVEELAAHDVETGHPNPTGGELAPALARVQELCSRLGGHEPSLGDPAVCGVCGAGIPENVGGRFRCREAGCDFSSADPGELEAHDITVHGLQEVAPVVPDRLRRMLQQSMCSARGHIPNPINPTACLACGSPLEVPRD